MKSKKTQEAKAQKSLAQSKKALVSLLAITLLVSSISTVLASNFDKVNRKRGFGQDNEDFNQERIAKREERKQRKEEMKQIISTGDFDAWAKFENERIAEKIEFLQNKVKELEEKKSKITAETFAKIVEAHKLKENGDYEAAREIMEELGFRGGHKMHKGGMKKFNNNQE